MMASLQKQLQNLQMRLRQENENHNQNNGSNYSTSTTSTTTTSMTTSMTTSVTTSVTTSMTSSTTACGQKNENENQQSKGTQMYSGVQQFPRRQLSLSATQRQPNNSNLHLNFTQNSSNRNNTSNTNVFDRQNGSHSQSLNAQCLSPRPRPRQLIIDNNISQGRPGSPSRAAKPSRLFPSNDNHFQSDCRNKFNNANDDNKLNEMFKQNNSVLTIDGKKYSAQDVDLFYLDELGSGSCGHVVKMCHLPSKKVVAVKQMRRSGNKEENKRITMDLDILLACHNCPNIVQCYGYFIKDTEVWICMELMTTCFDKLLKKLKTPIPEPILGKISVATVKALNYLKDHHGVIHRDVKPSNILINEKGVVKLCDFGISGRLVDSKAKTRSAGCAAYMAPERIDPPDTSNPSYDIRADVWSLGITLVELATGKFPYHECRTDFEVLTKVVQEDPPSLPSDAAFSLNFCSFVKSCLTKDYRKRPKYKKLLEHPFIKTYEKANIDVEQWFTRVMSSESLAEPQLSPININ